jgi:hypothetical protein
MHPGSYSVKSRNALGISGRMLGIGLALDKGD